MKSNNLIKILAPKNKTSVFGRMFFCVFSLLFFVLSPLPSPLFPVYGADWPTFRGNNQRTGFTREQAHPPLSEVWSFQIQGDVISSPVVFDGKVYVGSRSGSVYAFNAETGELIWDFSSDDWIDASCAVSSAAVFIPSRDGNLYALDKDNGNLLWQTDLGASSISSPLYLDGKVYVGVGIPENKIKAFNASSGNLLWQYSAQQPVDSSPSTDGVNIYFGGNDGIIYALNKDSGILAWPAKPTNGSFGMTTVAVSSGSVYALPGHDEKKLYIFKSADGSEINSSESIDIGGEAEVASPVISKDNIYFAMGSFPETLYAYKRDSLESVWSSSPTLGNTAASGILSSPAMANEIIYVGTADGRFVAVSSIGVSAMTDINFSTSAFSSPAVSNGMVFIGRQGGKLMAYKAAKIASISKPESGDIIDLSAEIRGYIKNPDLSDYILEYGQGENPSSWTMISSAAASSEIKDGLLSNWDTGLIISGVYTLRLTVNESVSHTSDNSAEILIRINHQPAPPQNLAVSDVPSDNGNKLSLSWQASTSTITAYEIYRKLAEDFSLLASIVSSSLTYIDSTAVTGTTFTYILRSYDGYMESENSNEASAHSINNDPSSDVTSPLAISDLSAAPASKGGEVLLSWKAPGNDNAVGTASHYIIRYSSTSSDLNDFDSAPLWKSARTVTGASGTSESENVEELFGGVTYYFAIKTEDFNANLSGISNAATAYATMDFVPPSPPSTFTVTDTQGDHGGSLTLKWELSSDDGQGAEDVYGYKIYRRTALTSFSDTPYDSAPKGLKKYVDSSATENIKYFYKIAAFDSSNNSEMSDEKYGISADNWRFFSASAGGIVSLQDGAIIEIPGNAISQNDNLLVRRLEEDEFSVYAVNSYDPASLSANPTSIVYEIKFENNTTKLNGLAKITLPYTDLEISGMDEENLRMYTREGNIWKMLNTSVTMLDENKVQAETNHFSIFRIMEYVPSGVLMDKASVYTYPNPAKGNTLTFKFYVADKSYVTVDVYSVAGQKVKRLEKANCPAGIVSEIVWDMGNVASGVYIYKVEAKSASGSEKVIKKLAIIH